MPGTLAPQGQPSPLAGTMTTVSPMSPQANVIAAHAGGSFSTEAAQPVRHPCLYLHLRMRACGVLLSGGGEQVMVVSAFAAAAPVAPPQSTRQQQQPELQQGLLEHAANPMAMAPPTAALPSASGLPTAVASLPARPQPAAFAAQQPQPEPATATDAGPRGAMTPPSAAGAMPSAIATMPSAAATMPTAVATMPTAVATIPMAASPSPVAATAAHSSVPRPVTAHHLPFVDDDV